MKRFLMLVAVAAVAGAMYVAAAPGSQQATAPTAKQFTALKTQVAKLKKSFAALKKDETKVKTAAAEADAFIAACFVQAGVVPVNQFGDSTTGFLYGPTGGTTGATARTALDVDASATPGGYIQAVDSSCITSSSTAASHSSSSHLPVLAERAR